MSTDTENVKHTDKDGNPAHFKRGRADIYDGVHNKPISSQIAMDVVTAPILKGIDTDQLLDWENRRNIYERQMNERAPGAKHMSYILSMDPNKVDDFVKLSLANSKVKLLTEKLKMRSKNKLQR